MLACAACDPAATDDDDGAAIPGCDASDGDVGQDTGPAPGVPIAVDCSFGFDGEQIDVTYPVGDDRIETPVGGKLIAGGMLSDSEYEGRSFSLVVYAEDSSVLHSSLYQLARDRLPANEFYGDHGFTGLHGVKDPDAQENVQFACFARDPADPVHVWQD